MEHIEHPPGIEQETIDDYRQIVERYRGVSSVEKIPGRWDWHRRILLNEILAHAGTIQGETLDMLVADNHVLSPNDRTRELLQQVTQSKIRMLLVNPEPLSEWKAAMELYAPHAEIRTSTMEDIRGPQRVAIGNASLLTEHTYYSFKLLPPSPEREITAIASFDNSTFAQLQSELFTGWWEVSKE